MQGLKVCIIGGTGFVGSALVNRLSQLQCEVKVFSRRPYRNRHLKLLPGVSLSDIDYFAPKLLERQFDNMDVVINLVGIIAPRGSDSFHKVHVELTRRITEAASAVKVPRLLHMSALNAGNSASRYLLSKGQGQQIAHQAPDVNVTIFCPSVIFGPHDHFFNLFAWLLQLPGPMPLVGAHTRYAPIYVEDVVDAFINSINKPACHNKIYNLCGPREYSLLELVRYVRDLLHSRKTIIPLGAVSSPLIASMLGWLPGMPINREKYQTMTVDSVCPHEVNPDLDLRLRSVESIVPMYLGSKEKNHQYQSWRALARR